MTLILHSKVAYEALCAQQSVDFMEKAIKQKKLPSRGEHALMSVIHPIFYEPGCLIHLIVNTARRIIESIDVLFKPENRQKKAIVFYNLSCIVLLDPFHFVCQIAMSVMRIASNILGIAAPSIASRGWLFALRLDAFNHHFKANLWKKIAPNNPYSNYETVPYEPKNAEFYLGNDALLSIARQKKEVGTILIATRELMEDFPNWLAHLHNKAPKLFGKLMKALPEDEAPLTFKKTNKVLQQIAPDKQQSSKDTPQIVKEQLQQQSLSIHDLDLLFKFLTEKNLPGTKGSRKEHIQENLETVLRYGMAKYPIPEKYNNKPVVL